MNKDLISRSALLAQECFMDDDNGFRCSVVLSTDVRDAPALDAVEVVRCKDCENAVVHRKCDGTVYCHQCDFFDIEIEPNDFCSYGERRNGE